jgi:hypothetical protein
MSNELPPTSSVPEGSPEGTDSVDTASEETRPATRRIADFPITEEELTVLARHYFKEIQGLGSLLHLQFSYRWQCEYDDLCRRLDRIRSHLGDAVVDAIEAELDQKDRAKYGTAAWRASGHEMADLDWQEHHRLREKAEDPDARARAIAHLSDHPTDLFFDLDADVWFLAMNPHAAGPGPIPVLHLRLKSRIGHEVGGDFSMTEPDGWFPPFGLG